MAGNSVNFGSFENTIEHLLRLMESWQNGSKLEKLRNFHETAGNLNIKRGKFKYKEREIWNKKKKSINDD